MTSKVVGRPCPKCGKKTLSHPSMWGGKPGWDDHSRCYCRSCGARFKLKAPDENRQINK